MLHTTMSDIKGAACQLQGIVKEICSDKVTDEIIDVQAEKGLLLIEKIPELDLGCHDHRSAHGTLESAAVKVWNHVIALRAKDSNSLRLHAKLRHMSAILEYKCNGSSKDEFVLKKVIMMTLKTARSWLDRCDAEKAGLTLQLSSKCIDRLHVLIIGRKNRGENVTHERMEADKDRFKLLCCKAEGAVMLKEYKCAMEHIALAKQLLSSFPHEGTFLSMLCFNFGVEAFEHKCFEESVCWLRESYVVGKDRPEITPENQGRCLRMLANAYLEWKEEEGHLQKALNAISLANSEHHHSSGLYLRLKLLILSEEGDQSIWSGVEDILDDRETTLQHGLQAVTLLTKSNKKNLAVDVLKQLHSKYAHTGDIGKVYALQLKILLEDNKEEEAKAFVEETITGHYTHQPLDERSRRNLHTMFWERAGQLFEAKHPGDAVLWYNFSLSLFTSNVVSDGNLAKLHRNRAGCFLLMNQVEKAKEASLEAEKVDRNSPYTQLILFKVALAEGDAEKAKISIKRMTENMKKDSEEKMTAREQHSLLCLAAQLAFDADRRDVAVTALECLTEHRDNSSRSLIALRCLVRLRVAESDKSKLTRSCALKVIEYLKLSYKQLQSLQTDSLTDIPSEASWFMKIAWNMGLQCDEFPEDMKELFLLSNQFTSLCSEDEGSLSRQKTCLLMVIASCLQLVRQIEDMEEKNEILQETLKYIEDCKKVSEKITHHSMQLDINKKDTREIMLLLYEFEAKTKLGHPDVEAVLERALSLPNCEPKTYETMAALAMEAPAQNTKISMMALKAAIRKHLQAETLNCESLSKVFQSLIELALRTGRLIGEGVNEEAFSYYKEVLDIIDKTKNDYPETEALWLMTKAWNQGIYVFSNSMYMEAERWCGLSLRFLRYLPSLKKDYEEKMNSTYGEILAKIEDAKKKGMEE